MLSFDKLRKQSCMTIGERKRMIVDDYKRVCGLVFPFVILNLFQDLKREVVYNNCNGCCPSTGSGSSPA